MPKRRSGGRDGRFPVKRTRRMPKRRSGDKRRQQHLYLALDDWSRGYSIRKLDLPSNSDSESPQRLPHAAFRLEARHQFPKSITSAFGSKIITMPLNVRNYLPPDMDCSSTSSVSPFGDLGRISMLDVCSRGLTFIPKPSVDLLNPTYISVGHSFVLCSNSFQMLHNPAVAYQPCMWHELPMPPFENYYVTSYAVHPDGKTIFVSAKKSDASTDKKVFTYSFNIYDECWKKQGDWALPFKGPAHFDSDLDAWVGLSGDIDATRCVCACDVVPTESDGNMQRPMWKSTKEVLFSKDPNHYHVGATLLLTGSKFCLVQCVSVIGSDTGEMMPDPDLSRCLFRLTTFSLRYDRNGVLTTGNSCRVRYYKGPDAAAEALFEPIFIILKRRGFFAKKPIHIILELYTVRSCS